MESNSIADCPSTKSYHNMLKLVLGALIGGANYEDVYMESELENENENNITEDEHQSTSMNKIVRSCDELQIIDSQLSL